MVVRAYLGEEGDEGGDHGRKEVGDVMVRLLRWTHAACCGVQGRCRHLEPGPRPR